MEVLKPHSALRKTPVLGDSNPTIASAIGTGDAAGNIYVRSIPAATVVSRDGPFPEGVI